MKNIFFAVSMLLCLPLFAQEKGASPLHPKAEIANSKSVRAVVIGISDYQDEKIPDLRFADRDAEAFAGWLRSSAGGALDEDHLKVLTNEQATAGQFSAALDWLLEASEEGSQVILFFAGHGDVESKLYSQLGFLLCWDAPARAYMAGGTIPLFYIEDVIATLSQEKKVRVVLVADACHSGSLAGSNISGSQLTNANLIAQHSNEVKILACQPNEYALEGEQWGGGHGVFSYHLVDALYGLADSNKDLVVTLQETGRYLEDHVAADVAPISQTPLVNGNRTEQLAIVDTQLLARLRSGRSEQIEMFSAIESRGLEEDVLAAVDTTTRELYRLFKKALKEKVFLPVSSDNSTPADMCADALYQRLLAEPKLTRLHTTMTRNYAAALQDDAQQVMNKWLKSEIKEVTQSTRYKASRYALYPQYLQRAAELLGQGHPMYKNLLARRYLFEGYISWLKVQRSTNRSRGMEALQAYRRSLEWQPAAPHTYLFMAQVFAWNLSEPDSARLYAARASELAPGWVLPYTSQAIACINKYGDFERAESLLATALQLDSNSVFVHNYLGALHVEQLHFDQAIAEFKKAISLDSAFSFARFNLGYVMESTGNLDKARSLYQETLSLDSTCAFVYEGLGRVYQALGQYHEASKAFLKTIELDSSIANAYSYLGTLLSIERQYDNATGYFQQALELNPYDVFSYSELGRIAQLKNQIVIADSLFEKATKINLAEALYCKAVFAARDGMPDNAIHFLEQALQTGYDEYGWIRYSDPDMQPLRGLTEFNSLIKKYFPEQTKD
jgi:tetratricopeptide (TPR) repeat protein/uncharacterized caspase-like protein